MHVINVASLGLHILEVEITTRCNLNCKICYNRDEGVVDLPFETIVDLFEFAKCHKVARFVISGGEAVFHPDFVKLAQYIQSNPSAVEVVIQSNGLVGQLPPALLKGFKLVHLSIEPEETGVRLTSPNEIIATAKRFKDTDIYTYLFATVHPGNIDKIDWMVDLANESNVDIGFNLCIPVRHRDQLAMTREQRVLVMHKLFDLSAQKRILRFTNPLTALLRGVTSPEYIGNRGGCTAGIAACSVMATGDVIPCPFFRFKVGNIFDEGLRSIWLKSELFTQIRYRNEYDKPCGGCEYLSYCGGCRARAYSQTGKLSGADPDCLPELVV